MRGIMPEFFARNKARHRCRADVMKADCYFVLAVQLSNLNDPMRVAQSKLPVVV